MFDEKKMMFQELSDEDLDQVAGGSGLFGGILGSALNTVNGTVSNATTTATSTSLPHVTGGANIGAQTPAGSVNLSLGTDLGF
jgi:bacteriocin-like protein